jgi:hypothetical protein
MKDNNETEKIKSINAANIEYTDGVLRSNKRRGKYL